MFKLKRKKRKVLTKFKAVKIFQNKFRTESPRLQPKKVVKQFKIIFLIILIKKVFRKNNHKVKIRVLSI